jgi:hypothetical protein
VHRDLLKSEKEQLQGRIVKEGWGARLLSYRKQDGHWRQGFYQPKWTSTHYTLLDLKNLAILPKNTHIRQTLSPILKNDKSPEGGIYPIGINKKSDVCVNGMFLNYASYFAAEEDYLKSIVDFLLFEHMSDGGFNCYSNPVRSASHKVIGLKA